MNKHAFTLIEMLTVIVIIGVLVSIALPMYTRSIERSRATEAMAGIKAMNDSIYAYYADRETCPTSFSQLIARLPSVDSSNTTQMETKYFRFTMGGSGAPDNVLGTPCKGVLAKRIGGGGYSYEIWNPYKSVNGKALSLKCAAGTSDKDADICESFGWQENATNNN